MHRRRVRAAAQASSAAPVAQSVASAAQAQRLRTLGADVAEISAITQRLIDSQGAEFCALRSLDDVQ